MSPFCWKDLMTKIFRTFCLIACSYPGPLPVFPMRFRNPAQVGVSACSTSRKSQISWLPSSVASASQITWNIFSYFTRCTVHEKLQKSFWTFCCFYSSKLELNYCIIYYQAVWIKYFFTMKSCHSFTVNSVFCMIPFFSFNCQPTHHSLIPQLA